MTRKSYDDIRAEAEPCLGGCGLLVTHPPRYCNKCVMRIARDPKEFARVIADLWPKTQGGTE